MHQAIRLVRTFKDEGLISILARHSVKGVLLRLAGQHPQATLVALLNTLLPACTPVLVLFSCPKAFCWNAALFLGTDLCILFCSQIGI